MPQQYDWSLIPDQPEFQPAPAKKQQSQQQDQFDWSLIPDQPEYNPTKRATPPPEVDKPWYEDLYDQFTLPNAVRFGGSALSDLAGGAIALGTEGFGTPLGLAVAGLGGGASEALARKMEGQPFDMGINTVEGVFNMVPGARGVPGKGAALKEVMDYALRSGKSNAIQAAVGAFPRHEAAEGKLFSPSEWTMPSAGEVAGQTVGGFGMGTVMGAGFGLHGAKYGKTPHETEAIPGTNTDVNAAAPPLPPEATPPPPTGAAGPVTASMRARLRSIGLSDADIEQLDYREAVRIIGFDPTAGSQPPPTDTGGVPPTGPTVPPTNGGGGNPFVSPDEQTLFSRGYSESDLIDLTPEEIQRMANAARAAETAPPNAETPPTAQARPSAQQEQAIRPGTESAINPGEVAFNNDQPRVPTANLVRPGYIENLRRGGFMVDKMGPEFTTLKPIPPEAARLGGEELGGGNEPDVASSIGDETIGGPMGRVAHFPSSAKNLYEITQQLRQHAGTGNVEGIMNRAQEIIDNYTRVGQAQTDHIEIRNLIDNARNADEAELLQHIADSIKEKGDQLNAAATQGMGTIRPMSELRQEFVPDQPPPENFSAGRPPSTDLRLHPVDDNATGPTGIVPPPDFTSEIGEMRGNQQLENISSAQPESIDFGTSPRADDMFRPTASEARSPEQIMQTLRRKVATRTASRQEILRVQIDDAYRANDMKTVVDLSQQLDRINNPMAGAKGPSMGARTPEDRFAGYSGNRGTVTRDTNEVMRERVKAAKDQIERGKALGVDRTKYQTEDEFMQAIHEARQNAEPAGMKRPDTLTAQQRADAEPSKLEVKETTTKGRSNIAIGPKMDDTRILDVLGTTLYTKDRPTVVVTELLQNAADEMKLSGNKGPIRIVFRYGGSLPGGTPTQTIVMKDFGRGLTADQLYTIFTDIGKTGKGNDPTASGGFGFAKAAPMLGGKWVSVESIVDVNGKKVRYFFQGDPKQLKNQQVGVPLDQSIVSANTPTGLKVEVHFEQRASLYQAGQLLKKTVKNTPGLKGVEFMEDFHTARQHLDNFLENGTMLPGSTHNTLETLDGQPVPTYRTSITTPENVDMDFHYDLDNKERRSSTVAVLNNGLFALEFQIGHGQIPMPHVPEKIVINLKSQIEEGGEGYPFGLNRQALDGTADARIRKWIDDNISTPAETMRVAELQKIYDDLAPNTAVGNSHVIHDSGTRYLPDERARLENSPHLNKVADIMSNMLDRLHTLFPVGPGGQLGTTVKYGWLLADPGSGGINVPDPSSMGQPARNFAVMVNPFSAILKEANPSLMAARLTHYIIHEFNHNRVRGEGSGFTWAFADTDTKFGLQERANAATAIRQSLTGPDGNYVPEVRELLQDYQRARGRADLTVDTLSRQRASEISGRTRSSGVSGNDKTSGGSASAIGGGPPPPGGPTVAGGAGEPPKGRWQKLKEATGWGQGATRIDKTKEKEYNFLTEALSVPTGATTMLDFSAPGRQGLSMILTPQFWSAAGKMFKGLSAESFKRMDADLKSKPLFQKRILADGTVDKSMAEKIGTKIFAPASELGPRAEGAASRWLETGGSIPGISTIYKHTVGYPIRATNRAYITFLNHLNVNRTEYLLNRARDMAIKGMDTGSVRPGFFGQKVTQSQAAELNPYHNIQLAKEIADFVNTATGHGPLKTHILPFKQTEVSLEHASKTLGRVLFSPGLLASRIRMLNPNTYIMASPYVRKQYLKAAVSTAGAWFAFAELAKMAGGDEVQVSTDPTSADFGKVRIGDTRLDAAGGFQQFLVAFARSMAGGATSSSTGQFHPFGEGYQAQTQEDMMQRFMVNKLNPTAKFAYDIANASQYNPFHLGDRTLQMFIPLIAQDMQEMAKNNPELLPWMVPAMFGMGTQTYSKGESVGKLVDPRNDILIGGGIPPNHLGGLRP